MPRRTLLVAENLPRRVIEQEVLTRSRSIVGVLVRNRDRQAWEYPPTGVRVVSEADVMGPAWHDRTSDLHERFPSIYAALAANPSSLLILERHYFSTPMVVEGTFRNAGRLARAVWNALGILAELEPTHVVCASTPHVPADWVLVETARLLGVPISLVGIAPLLWRAWCLDGLREQRVMDLGGLLEQAEKRPSWRDIEARPPTDVEIDDFVTMNRGGDYLAAVPTIDRAAQSESDDLVSSGRPSGGGIWGTAKETGRFIRLGAKEYISRLIGHRRTAREKAALFEAYSSFAAPLPQDRKLVSLFLHFQPERTTMPEGGVYANQLLIAQALATALPNGWHVAVKEHPATFLGPGQFARAFHDAELYRSVARLPNTSIVPMGVNSFELIDRSSLVATVTGTVGLQSLSRGTPVVAFGSASYRGSPGAHSLPAEVQDHIPALKDIFAAVEQAPEVPLDAFRRYLHEVGANSIGSFGAVDGEEEGSGVFLPSFTTRARAVALLTP